MSENFEGIRDRCEVGRSGGRYSVVISVGYRVKSQRGVQFRIWATNILKKYIKKGFAMDDDRLKELGGAGNSYDNGRLGKASGQDFDVHRRKPSHGNRRRLCTSKGYQSDI